MRRNTIVLLIVFAVAAFCLWFLLPIDGERLGKKGIRLGLDLQGGTQLVYEADLSKKDPAQTVDDAMKSVVQTIETRVNKYGVAEPVIQRQGQDRVLVQLPGVKNIKEAVDLIGKTAQLDFREQQVGADGKTTWLPAKALGTDGQEKELNGSYLKPNAHVELAPNTNAPEVAFEFNAEGAFLFKQITTRLINKPLGIFLDNEQISAPTVQAVIEDKGVITGLTLDDARLLSIELQSGALTLPLNIIQQQDVDASLGADSIRLSMIAGIIGVILLLLFMVAYYRLPGFQADVALMVYGLMVLTVFKFFQFTLTLSGVAAFIISLGMAVDANILIMERMKEELMGGKTLGAAIEAGFQRAWSAIIDSNVTTLIACAILFWFGYSQNAASVIGFSITLAIGVLISLLSAVLVSRVFLRAIAATGLAKYRGLFQISRLPEKKPSLTPATAVAGAGGMGQEPRTANLDNKGETR